MILTLDQYPCIRRLWLALTKALLERTLHRDLRSQANELSHNKDNCERISADREVESRLTLADFLRHDLRLTGRILAANMAMCGACTVLLRESCPELPHLASRSMENMSIPSRDWRMERNCLRYSSPFENITLTVRFARPESKFCHLSCKRIPGYSRRVRELISGISVDAQVCPYCQRHHGCAPNYRKIT